VGDTSKIVPPAVPRKNAPRAPKVREACFEDYEQIAPLESRYGLGTLGAQGHDKWMHYWLGNPLYRELQPDWSIGWVLEDESGQIVGSVENIPLLYEFQGRRILTASARAWVVEPAYRGAGLFLLDQVINQRGVDLYVNTSAGPGASGILSFFKCSRVPVGAWDESAFWITNYRGFLEGALAMKNYKLARPLSYPLSAAAFVKDKLTKKALREGDVEVKACSGFDDRFDSFWLDLKAKNPHLLLAVRTREALEWHFKHALLGNRLWIVTIDDGPRLAAYAVFDRTDNPNIGFKRMRLLDFQSLDGGAALLSPMLSWALRKCRAEGIDILENFGRYLEGEEFANTASYRRKLAYWLYYYRANTPGLAESLADPRAWAPSLFDGDASL
jgi:hypothetical protein